MIKMSTQLPLQRRKRRELQNDVTVETAAVEDLVPRDTKKTRSSNAEIARGPETIISLSVHLLPLRGDLPLWPLMHLQPVIRRTHLGRARQSHAHAIITVMVETQVDGLQVVMATMVEERVRAKVLREVLKGKEKARARINMPS